MIITIHQPEHLPWLGFFNKLAKAELFVILDHVQYEKNYFQSRNKIIGTNGPQWLCIPVITKGHMDGSIANTEISLMGGNARWKEKYLQTIRQSYGKYPFFSEVYPVIETVYNQDSMLLCDYNIGIIKAFSEKLGFTPEFVRSKDLNVSGLKSDLILDICKVTNATTYIAGPSGRDYLDMQSFADAGIKVVFNDFHHPSYPQKRTEEFLPYMSSVDLFMNVGFEEGRRIIMDGNEGISEQ